MSLQERFAKFEKVFPTLGIKFDEWKKLKQWNDTNPITDKLDLSIFPDSIKRVEWEFGTLRQVIIPETMTKLEALNLTSNHIDKIVIPETVKLKQLSLELNPLRKFKLGGSIGTLEQLALPTEMPVEKVRIPAGLTALKYLNVGSLVGAVALSKDMASLTELHLSIRPEDGKIKIPNELTALKELHVEGNVKTLVISPKHEKLALLAVRTANSELALPRALPNLKRLYVNGGSIQSLVVPNGLGTSLTSLDLTAPTATEVVLPKGPEALVKLDVVTAKADVTVPAKAINLVEVNVVGQNVVYNAKSPDLKKLKVNTGADAQIKTAQVFEKIERLHLFVGGEAKIKLPEAMPALESIAVPTGIIPEGAEYADKALVASTF